MPNMISPVALLKKSDSRPWSEVRRGFTLVELVITIGIAAAVITAAILALGAFQRARETANLIAVVDIGSSRASSFFDLGTSTIQTWNAPSFGRRALAEEMRDVFLEDVAQSSAVFALARETNDSLRPDTLVVPVPAPSSPDQFRTALVTADASAGTVFSSETTILRRSDPSSTLPVNSSIFLIGPSSPESLNIRAIYEIDFVPITAGGNNAESGTYAAVRRYVGGSLTFFYDVFYPADETVDILGGLAETRNAAFSPVARRFSDTEAASWFDTDRRPRAFYFFWWPDPGVSRLNGEILVQSFSVGDPREAYPNMGGRTAFFLTVPQFPSQ